MVEGLEAIRLLSCDVISGYVYHDLNNNGVRDPLEEPIAGSRIELHDSSGALVATTITDADGYYGFDHDPRVDTTPRTLTYSAGLGTFYTPVGSATASLPKFDPALGTLESVALSQSVSMFNRTRIENRSPAPSLVTQVTFSGGATVEAPGLDPLTTNLQRDLIAGAGLVAPLSLTGYDGVLDYAGTSGLNFGDQTVQNTSSLATTDPAVLALYTAASGTADSTFSATARSTVSSTGGNFATSVLTQAAAMVQVTYTYRPSDCLAPGTYTLVQSPQPSGYLDGQETAGNVTPIPNSADGPDSIVVILDAGHNSEQNNFGELKPTRISGTVYHDINESGVYEVGVDAPIPGVTITLQGTDDLGRSVTQTTQTLADGTYAFNGLRPGTYSVFETQPDGYEQGTNNPGQIVGRAASGDTVGNVVADSIRTVPLAQQQAGIRYNFGEVLTAEVGNFVWSDLDGDGLQDANEPGIAGVTLILTGTTVSGEHVNATTVTDTDGRYLFSGLIPGSYTVRVDTTSAALAGYISTAQAVGNNRQIDSNASPTTVTLAGGQSDRSIDFGFNRNQSLVSGDTATIGFWQNKNGQALIRSLNGGHTSTALGTWLATNFPYLYGSHSSSNLNGKSNDDVAAHFVTLFKAKGMKVEAQTLAVALAIYVTDSSLAGNAAQSYGFNVSTGGTGGKVANVGSNGSAVGLVNDTSYTVFSLLKRANDLKQSGGYDANAFNDIFDGINTKGDRK